MILIQGKGVSAGVAMGPLYFYQRAKATITRYEVEDTDAEWARFKNAQGHTIYSFGEELDTLRKTNGAGSWSSKYDIYRLSFDKGEWGQDYNSDAAESGVVNVAYNWTMLGTNGALRKCFKSDNIENGLSSRILVAEMPDASFSKMPKF